MNTETDGQLVSRCVGGDITAFETLVERHRTGLLRYTRKRACNISDAEDMAQETFVHAYFRMHQLREPEKFLPWLRTIAERFCLMHLRRRREEAVEPAEMEQLSAKATRSDDTDVQDALGALPKPMLEAVKLTYLLGYSNAEAAEILGVCEGTIKSRLHRARAILRMELGIMTKERTDHGFNDKVVERLMRRAQALMDQRDYLAAEEPLDEVLSLQFEYDIPFDPEAVRMAEKVWDEMRRRDTESNARQYGRRLEDLNWTITPFNTLCNSLAAPGGEGADLWGVPREVLPHLVDARDVCRRLKISPATLHRFVHDGMPVIRYRPWMRFDWERVLAWLADKNVEPDTTMELASRPLRYLFTEIESGRLTASQAERLFQDLDLPPV